MLDRKLFRFSDVFAMTKGQYPAWPVGTKEMAPLTQDEVDGVVAELGPFLTSEAKKIELGLGAYKALLCAKPEYIQMFTKLQGLTVDNVFQSEGIKYYAKTLVEDLVKMLMAAVQDDELQSVLVHSGHQHTSRKVNKQQFMVEVDGVVAELGPFLASDIKKVELGLGAYKALFKAKPEYIQLFSKLQGLNIDNVFQSDGIKYYAGTLVAELVRTFTVAAKEEELHKALIHTAQQHTSRNVNKQQLMSGEPIFIDFFNKTLSKPENKATMEKFLKHAFPAIASHI
ncbi:hypothetical protein P879_01080 [Paragonimus westermani]|uniref:Globin domain-containing protein n=1 Tax=Paragonimus westermani TaxID=34504 RepID=A0A8T0DKL7_9TREM|nr:hypothetical protein P879_01080 [Paragonimus westermani]